MRIQSAFRSAVVALGLLVVGASAHAAHQAAPAPAPHASAGPVTAVAPQYRISRAYGTRLIKQVAAEVTGRTGGGRWKVTDVAAPHNGPIGAGTTRGFVASWAWTPGQVHPMVAVPNVTGELNTHKAPQAPQGKLRVTVTSPTTP